MVALALENISGMCGSSAWGRIWLETILVLMVTWVNTLWGWIFNSRSRVEIFSILLFEFLQLVIRVVCNHSNVFFHQFDLLSTEGNLIPLQSRLSANLKQLLIKSFVFILLVLHISLQRLIISIDLRIHLILDIFHFGHECVHHTVNIVSKHTNVIFVLSQELVTKDHLLLHIRQLQEISEILTSMRFTWWLTVLFGSSAIAAVVLASGEKVLWPSMAILGLWVFSSVAYPF